MEKITLTIDKEVLKPLIYQIFENKVSDVHFWEELPEVSAAFDELTAYFKKVCGVPAMQLEADNLFMGLQEWAKFEGFLYGFIAAGGGSITEKKPL